MSTIDSSEILTDISVGVCSNVILNNFKNIFSGALSENGYSSDITIGDYDSILIDSERFQNCDVIVVVWELANLYDGVQYSIELADQELLEQIEIRFKSEIDIVLKNTRNTKQVILTKFCSSSFDCYSDVSLKLSDVCIRLNEYISSKSQSNVSCIDTHKIFSLLGVNKSIDYRFFYSSKNIYTNDYLGELSNRIITIINSIYGKTKKVLVLDCDNTLWKGIIGEDGLNGIDMSPNSRKGVFFAEVQSLYLQLQSRGIILALCSKNNFNDVQAVIDSNKNMLIKDHHIAIKKINWEEKAENILNISNELNLGLDSFVFVDDSEFEIESVRLMIPDVLCVQVPKNLSEYPVVIRKLANMFSRTLVSKEDFNKTMIYKQEANRKALSREFKSRDEFLRSLELTMSIKVNSSILTSRISQMTQKTNQFNLTTRRYSVSEIEAFISSDVFDLVTFSVRDKFGDSGECGLCILERHTDFVRINTLLMSCRVIGRNLEYAFFDSIMKFIVENYGDKISKVYSEYMPTKKNMQVEKFYDDLGFQIISSEINNGVSYSLLINNYIPKLLDYIRIINE